MMRALTSFFYLMKYLYIDESFDEKIFVVGGVLVESENQIILAFKQLRKQIIKTPLTRKQKEKIMFELKSVSLDRSYPKIKRKLLYKLNSIDCNIIYSYRTIASPLSQEAKEKTYIELLSKIINHLKDEVIIITFDLFNNISFENKIIKEIGQLKNVKKIKRDLSFNNKGLQFADNVVGTIRRHISGIDINNDYEIISNKVISV